MRDILMRLWPRGMAGRTVLLFLLSLTGFHLGSLWIHHHDAVEGMGSTDAVASTTVMAIGIVVVSVLLVRWMTGPLRRLAQTADQIGRGRTIPVPHNGPEEVRRLAQALDAMQTRITRLVDDRTQALAAVSHDLRTPITRMRLRAGFLDDSDAQARMEADLDEMEGMIAATLAYLQGETESEARQLTDVGVLLSTLCDAATDAGGIVAFKGPAHLDVLCRPVALRRAVSNLIANAVTYGGVAEITLATESDRLWITIDDDGPGIASEEL
jgi:signal transduction histidine kinase